MNEKKHFQEKTIFEWQFKLRRSCFIKFFYVLNYKDYCSIKVHFKGLQL